MSCCSPFSSVSKDNFQWNRNYSIIWANHLHQFCVTFQYLHWLLFEHLCIYSFAFCSVLLLAEATGIHKSFLVPLFALQAPPGVISWINPTYGALWYQFVMLGVNMDRGLLFSRFWCVCSSPFQVNWSFHCWRCYLSVLLLTRWWTWGELKVAR